MAEKPHLNLAIIGHVDHGKSTLVGRMLYEKGIIDDRVIEEFEAMGDKGESFKFAWVMDTIKEERDRGLTIDLAHKRFDTDKYYFTIIDAPGHRDFVKNMITGTSQADAAILVVAADDGIMPQTREHAALAFTLGVGQIVVAVNKMDLVDYEESTFEDLKSNLIDFLTGIGFKNPEDFDYLPTSAFYGENVTKPSEKMDWFKGPTFYSSLDTFEVPEKPLDKPLRIPVQDVYSIKGVGTVPVGRVETGVLKPGEEVIFQPSGNTATVKTIEMHHEEVPKAEPGDNVGFNVRGLSRSDITRGEVVSHINTPPAIIEEFTAKIAVLEHPTGITAGYTPVFHSHTAQVACEITEISEKLDRKTEEVVEGPDFIKPGDMATIKVRPTGPMVIEEAGKTPELSRFAIRDMGKTIAAGTCISATEKK